MTHQRVILTRWWSGWLTRGKDSGNDAPTSQCDSLVCLGGRRGAGVVRTTHQRVNMTCWWLWWSTRVTRGWGGQEQRTNESHQLVGGLGGRRGARMARTTHQRVILTRWWSWWSTRGRDGKNDAPTSHIDSLVVLVVDEEPRWRERRTNESY
jgi:hypothetical protein